MSGRWFLRGLFVLVAIAAVIGKGKRRGRRDEGGSPRFGRRRRAHEPQSA